MVLRVGLGVHGSGLLVQGALFRVLCLRFGAWVSGFQVCCDLLR